MISIVRDIFDNFRDISFTSRQEHVTFLDNEEHVTFVTLGVAICLISMAENIVR
jgi:hypothetical protein